MVGVDAGSVSGGLLPLWGDLAGAHLVAQPIALPADLDDVGVVQQPIEHGRGERLVAGKGLGPLGKRQVAGQHDGAMLVALGHGVEEEVGFLSPERHT